MSVSDNDLRDLIAFELGTTPGPWASRTGDDFVYSTTAEGDDASMKRDGYYRGELIGESMRPANRRYIVAAQPSVVAAMARELLERRGSPLVLPDDIEF